MSDGTNDEKLTYKLQCGNKISICLIHLLGFITKADRDMTLFLSQIIANVASLVFAMGVAAHVTHSYQPSKLVIRSHCGETPP